jgi:hypothetical protein
VVHVTLGEGGGGEEEGEEEGGEPNPNRHGWPAQISDRRGSRGLCAWCVRADSLCANGWGRARGYK